MVPPPILFLHWTFLKNLSRSFLYLSDSFVCRQGCCKLLMENLFLRVWCGVCLLLFSLILKRRSLFVSISEHMEKLTRRKVEIKKLSWTLIVGLADWKGEYKYASYAFESHNILCINIFSFT